MNKYTAPSHKTTDGKGMKPRFLFVLTLIIYLMTSLTNNTYAQEAYAVYENGTLTFYYDNNRTSRTGTKYALNARTGTSNLGEAQYNTPGWLAKTDISKVVFDDSFADARPTTCYRWFDGLSALKYCVGMENLNTSQVTSMERMFAECSSLTSLDLSNFDTYNVTNTASMFEGCSNLAAICITEDEDHWNLSRVNRSAYMFRGCAKLIAKAPLLIRAWIALGGNPDISFATHNDYGFLVDASQTYTVTFVVDGTVYKVEQCYVCQTISRPDVSEDYTLNDDSHSFRGWYIDAACSVEYTFNQGVTDNMILYAKYSKHLDYVTVHFDGNGSNGGTPMTPVQFYYGAPAEQLPGNTFEKTEKRTTWILIFPITTTVTYKFVGWSRNPNGPVEVIDKDYLSFTTPVEGDAITLRAIWEEDMLYYAIWHKNNGTNSFSDICSFQELDDSKGEFVVPEAPERDGYDFDVWSTSQNTRTPLKTKKLNGGSMAFYAFWTPHPYEITFDLNDEGAGASLSGVDDNKIEYNIESPDIYLDDDYKPFFDGYEFGGWYSDAQCSEGKRVTVVPQGSTGDMTVYAKWIPNPYEVKWYYNYPNENQEVYTTDLIQFGSDIYAPTEPPAPEGYAFVGWSATENGEVEATFGRMDDINGKNFYAQWKAAKKTLTFYNGTELISTYTLDYGTAIRSYIPTSMTHPTGYDTFDNWYYDWDEDKEHPIVFPDNMPSYDITAYANWLPNNYTVNFDGNEGTSENPMDAMQFTYGEAQTLIPNTFKRENYEFRGWAEIENKNVVKYADKAEVCNLTETPGGEVTLYAVWKSQYTVVFHANYPDNAETAEQTFIESVEQIFIDNPFSRDGYHLTGWATSAGGQEEYFNDYPVKFEGYAPGATIDLYAKWGGNQYKLTFDKNASDASGTMSQQDFGPDETVTLNQNKYERNGYRFVGWAETATGVKKYEDKESLSPITYKNDQTLYAKWSKIYTITYVLDDGTLEDTDNPTEYIEEDLSKITLPTPTKTDYDFQGWYSSPDFSESSKVTAITTVGNYTLYAKWTTAEYSITYTDVDGCDWPNGENPTSYNVGTPTFFLKNPTKPYHTFLGWSGTGIIGTSQEVRIAKGSKGDREYTAKWNPEPFDAVWHKNDGTDATTTTSVNYGAAITAPTDFLGTRTGYTFKGWGETADATEAI
ncbi:MAG: InlB B-repeat-containing protein, partial [Bacteroidales bacterium]|nr:InlB B-repeat-containing protein [Bacteroidales bacterium]